MTDAFDEPGERRASNGGRDYTDLPTLSIPPAPGELSYEEHGDMGPLWAALAKAQGAFEAINKTRTVKVQPKSGGPGYTFDYAELDEVIRKTRPALAANELCVIQPMHGLQAGKTLTTKLAHSSGACLTVRVRVPEANSIQDLGSSLTYLRRYSYSCLLGVATESDDDGNAAVGNQAAVTPKQQRDKPPTEQPKSGPMSKPLKEQIMQLSKEAGFTVVELKAFASRHEVDLEKADDAGGKKVLDALMALKVQK